ncbi:hypothetical protein [Leucobacter salsicius]|uniref:hypothetical protein n=1 Tax=Leucobacter salsicius TaxID=664638 RepID=UPI000345274B|nr:hypothetical protein [Leucobacter salsicius]
MHSQNYGGQGPSRRRGGRGLAAILFAAVLTFGPGAWAAQATVPDQAATVTAAESADPEAAPEVVPDPAPVAVPVPEAVPEPAEAPEPVAAPEPAPKPAAEPAQVIEAPEPQVAAPERTDQGARSSASQYPPPVTPAVSVTPPECVAVDAPLPTSITAHVTVPAGTFWLGISIGGWSAPEVLVSGSGDYELPLNGEGSYTVTLFNGGHYQVSSTSFVIVRCDEPVPTVPLSVAVSLDECTVPGGEMATTAKAHVLGAVVGQSYHFSLTKDGAEVWSDDVVATAITLDVVVPLTGAAEYAVTVSHGDDSDTATATLTPCPPIPPELALAIAFDQCGAPGGVPATSGTLIISGAVVGTTYHVTLQKDSAGALGALGALVGSDGTWSEDVVATATEFAVTVPLSGPGMYTAQASVGETVATATAELTPCPPEPPVPPVPPTPPVPPVVTTSYTPPPKVIVTSVAPKLAVTGASGGSEGMAVAGAVVLAGLVTMAAASGHRRIRARVVRD